MPGRRLVDIREQESVSRRVLCVGIDIGTRNMGIGIYDPITKKARKMIIDLHIQMNPKTKQLGVTEYGEKQIEQFARRIVDDFDELFSKVRWVGIEAQMKRRYIGLGLVLKAILNERHGRDGLTAFTTSPRSVRHHFGITGSSYTQRKMLSAKLMPSLIGPKNAANAMKKFKKAGKAKVDAMEAFLIAIYVHRMHRKLMFQSIQPPKFTKQPVQSPAVIAMDFSVAGFID